MDLVSAGAVVTTSKGGKPATGCVRWRFNPKREDPETGKPAPGFQWFGRVKKANGDRPFVELDPRIPAGDEAAAKVCAVETAKWFRDNPTVSDAAGETVGKWFVRFHAHKEAIGLESVDDMRGHANNWILPGIEHKAPRAVTREDIEGIVRRLDAAILAWSRADGKRGKGRLSPASAANVWGDVVHAFDEMVRAKEPSLRVLTVNPCVNVRAPESGADRAGPILYSDELLTLLRGKAVEPGCPDVPAWRRRVWAGATYTKNRRSELAAITKDDVDLAHLTIAITKQVARKKKAGGKIKPTKKTKTKRSRTIDVEPNLLPLIQWLMDHPEGKGGRLFRVPPPEDYAELLRKDLWTVGVRDPRLHTEDSTRTKMTGHCLRDTGLTHMAVRGDSPVVIQWTGGHTDFKQTQGYLDRGKNDARRIGEPLPPLPLELFDGPPTGLDPGLDPSKPEPSNYRKGLPFQRPQRELNPCYRRERPVS